jgi:hypothetical protein
MSTARKARVIVWLMIVLLWVVQVGPARPSAVASGQEATDVMADAEVVVSEQSTGSRQPDFDPDRIAYLEAAGWEAYYDRDWPRVFGLMVQMNREQFEMPLPTAVAAAIDIVRASIAFAPVDNDVQAATAHLGRFYDKARRSRSFQADAQTLAALEMDYWVVHRKLALERKQATNHDGDIEPMVAALARLHTGLFDAPPKAIRQSAEWRAMAAATVDHITGGYSTDVEADWRQVEEYLCNAYRSVR